MWYIFLKKYYSAIMICKLGFSVPVSGIQVAYMSVILDIFSSGTLVREQRTMNGETEISFR